MSTRWSHLKSDADYALEYGNYQEAEMLWRRALKETESFEPDDQRIPLTLDKLSDVLCQQQKYQEAESYLVRSAQFRDQHRNSPREEVAATLSRLCTVYYHLEKL